jgi:hypothetical protein
VWLTSQDIASTKVVHFAPGRVADRVPAQDRAQGNNLESDGAANRAPPKIR